MGPGCIGKGAGIAIPKRGEEYDYAALQSCVHKLKKSAPEYEEETQAYLSANPGIPYKTLIAVMDAIRDDMEGGALFPDVNFKVGK